MIAVTIVGPGEAKMVLVNDQVQLAHFTIAMSTLFVASGIGTIYCAIKLALLFLRKE